MSVGVESCRQAARAGAASYLLSPLVRGRGLFPAAGNRSMNDRIISEALRQAVVRTVAELRKDGKQMDAQWEAARLVVVHPECDIGNLIVLLVDEWSLQNAKPLDHTG